MFYFFPSVRLVFDMNNIFAFIFIIYFVWSLSTICSALLVVQLKLVEFNHSACFMWFKPSDLHFSFQEQSFNPLDLVKPMCSVFWSNAIIYLICEYGQMLTNYFDQLSNAFWECDWIAFPKDIQRIFLIIIHNAQQEVIIEIFDKASCSRETFKKARFLHTSEIIQSKRL